jgi:hypothetical protein
MMDRTDANDGWTVDPSGLNHWRGWVELGGNVLDGAARALATQPAGPCWFWWSGTPSPIAPGDTWIELVKRWTEWRDQSYDARGFVGKLAGWSSPDHVLADSTDEVRRLRFAVNQARMLLEIQQHNSPASSVPTPLDKALDVLTAAMGV